METGQFRTIRDLVAFGAAFITLVVLVLVVEMNFILGGIIAVLVFLGLFFILNPQGMKQILESRMKTIERRSSGSVVNFRIKLSQVKNIASRVENASIRNTLLDITEISGEIARRLESTPNAPTYVMTRLDYAFTLMMKVIGHYLYLVSSSSNAEVRRAEPLGNEIELDVLFSLEQGTREINDTLASGTTRIETQSIEQAITALETIVKNEGILS